MPQAPTAAEINQAAAILRAGRLVAFPTETVYGLGANALDPEAVARIYAVKRRPPTSPLIVHVASIEMAKSLVSAWPESAGVLTKKFWPGPLTLVLPTAHVGAAPLGRQAPVETEKSDVGTTNVVTADVMTGTPQASTEGSRRAQAEQSSAALSPTRAIPSIVTAGLPTVGLRMPAHPVALALIRAAGVPLAAPSANRFTELSPTTAEHVRRSLGDEVDMILDGGPCEVGIESTVLSLEDEPVLLRPGGISRHEIESLIGPITTTPDPVAGSHPAPGMHPRHYSPRTPLFLISNGKLPEKGQGIYLQHTKPPNRTNIETIQMPSSAAGYAAALYEKLHQADESHCDWIAVDLPPNTPEWEAIQDRLRRAASAS